MQSSNFACPGKLHPCLGFFFSYNRLERALDQRPSDYLPRKKICLLQTNRQDFCRVLQTACLFTPFNCPAQEATRSVAVTNRSIQFVVAYHFLFLGSSFVFCCRFCTGQQFRRTKLMATKQNLNQARNQTTIKRPSWQLYLQQSPNNIVDKIRLHLGHTFDR